METASIILLTVTAIVVGGYVYLKSITFDSSEEFKDLFKPEDKEENLPVENYELKKQKAHKSPSRRKPKQKQ